MILEILDHAAHRKPVHVDVGDRHEDRYLHHLPIEILALVYRFGHDHTAVAGGEDQIGVVDLHAARLAEERHDEKPEKQHQYDQHPHERTVVVAAQQAIDPRTEQQTNQAGDTDDFVTFLIDFHCQ